MSFVKDDPRRFVIGLAPARGIDHDKCMIGNHQVSAAAAARGILDEAFAVMRASGIDAFTAPVGECGRAVAAEQRRQPAGQIAANHIAVACIGRPTRHQMRKDRRASRKAALKRVFKV